ncbi:DUF6875 domain-containing protein [Streptomyces pristinaespiralis]|jgi:hypothetical protein|uniref:DUF6875 domain-containing protein n=1 Tax=Streptomyces pristinaespiralis TaxID=38300 RepID=UPI0033E99A22
MRGDETLRIYSPSEVEQDMVPPEHAGPLREVLEWSREFLVSGHPALGRSGPVCPYTQPSLRRDLFLLAVPAAGTDRAGLADAVAHLRVWYEKLAVDLDTEERELLTLLMVLPRLDRTDSAPLDALQRAAKDEFVAEGLMIGQFHPVCAEPGLWNEDFRPLRSPVPLLAVRRLLVFDLPFLVNTDLHLSHYLRQFAPGIPARMRDELVSRVVS